MFNPLGKFDPYQALSPTIIAVAREYAHRLQTQYPCAPGSISRIYAHWTAGHYGASEPAYNGAVRYDVDKQQFFLDVPGDPRDNASGDPSRYHSHTFRRNGHAFGIATDDMAFAHEDDFGPEPITLATTLWLCAGIAAAAKAYSVDIMGLAREGPYSGEPNVFSHAEGANHPGDPPQYANYYVTGERWDWATQVPLPSGVTQADVDPSHMGNAIRICAHRIKVCIV